MSARVGVFAYQAGTAGAFVPVIERLVAEATPVRVFCGTSAIGTFDAAGVAAEYLATPATMRVSGGEYSSVLTGTSWEPDFEASIWAECRRAGVKTVAFVDSWVNYAGRFTGAGGAFCVMPNAVAVVDPGMRAGLIEAGCARSLVHIVGHPALERLARETGEARGLARASIPASEEEFLVLWAADGIYHGSPREYPQPGELGYCDAELLEKSIAALNELARDRPVRLILRRHPASPDPALARVLDERANFPWVHGETLPKIPMILAADAILGGSSMLLLEAAILGRLVVSCLGPLAKAVPLLRSNDDLIRVAASSADVLQFLQVGADAGGMGGNRFSRGDAVTKILELLR